MPYLILNSPACLPIYKHLCPSFASSHTQLFSFTQPSTHQAHLSNHQNTFPSLFISVDNMGSALYYAGCEEHHHHQSHFLEACYLCRKPLGHNSDIFMYRGNTPFCSQECRQEQMEMDEATEKKSWKLSKRTSALRQTTTETTNKSSSPSKAVRTGTVVVA